MLNETSNSSLSVVVRSDNADLATHRTSSPIENDHVSPYGPPTSRTAITTLATAPLDELDEFGGALSLAHRLYEKVVQQKQELADQYKKLNDELQEAKEARTNDNHKLHECLLENARLASQIIQLLDSLKDAEASKLDTERRHLAEVQTLRIQMEQTFQEKARSSLTSTGDPKSFEVTSEYSTIQQDSSSLVMRSNKKSRNDRVTPYTKNDNGSSQKPATSYNGYVTTSLRGRSFEIEISAMKMLRKYAGSILRHSLVIIQNKSQEYGLSLNTLTQELYGNKDSIINKTVGYSFDEYFVTRIGKTLPKPYTTIPLNSFPIISEFVGSLMEYLYDKIQQVCSLATNNSNEPRAIGNKAVNRCIQQVAKELNSFPLSLEAVLIQTVNDTPADDVSVSANGAKRAKQLDACDI